MNKIDKLLSEYSEWAGENGLLHGSVSLAQYVVEVVIPRERSDATRHVSHLSIDWGNGDEEAAV